MPEKSQPLIVELEQSHQCTSIEVCDRLKDVRIKWLATIGGDGKTVTNLFEVDTEHLKETVRKAREHRNIREVQVVLIGPKKSQISVRQDRAVSTAPYLAKTGTMWLHPTWSEKGVDHVTMLAPSYKNLKAFIDLVKDKGYDLKIKSKHYIKPGESISLDTFRTSGFTKLKLAGELLTGRQMEAFDLACRYGYYEEPKKTSIEELARKLGVSPSTYAELLRKAEQKLLPVLNDIMRFMK
jgi:predicted DNA binding protein